MKLSLAVATNRNMYWRRLCESLAQNSVEMEVIFVGPVNGGMKDLPVPVRFIDVPEPDIGPARCWEIGARAATGDLIALPPDDVVYTPGFLDVVADAASMLHNPHDMFTARYVHNGNDSTGAMRMHSAPEMPLVPIGGFAYTATHHRIGGIDRRFTGVYWDSDLYTDLCMRGGCTTLLDGYTCSEVNPGHELYGRCSGADGPVLAALWPLLGVGAQRALPRERWGEYVPTADKGDGGAA